MKYRYKIEIGLCFIVLALVLIYLSSCVQMRPAGYAKHAEGYYEPVDYEPVVIEKRVKIVQYWKALPVGDNGSVVGYYYEYPSGSAGGGVYRWYAPQAEGYDTGEVIWDYPIE